ncbi:hypothetical protein L596_030587 [Steinernema carpocapsae]|uniref:Uncharacterized protein n=1 Tax=Steinernema carpocapsae TaxID=34508 RepID=A0A4U5LPT2_STECR|nr:hypothetical protein L596_030587 [Steinernema carpocapsae]
MPKKNTRRREKRKKAREEAKKVLNPAKCAARPEEKNLPKMRTETRVKQSNSKLIFDAKSNVIKGKLHTSEQQIVSKKRSAATLTPFPKQSNDKNSTKIVNKEHSKDKQEKNHVSFRSPSYLPTKDLTNTSLKADPNKGVSKKLTASNKPTITPIKDANNDNLNSKKTSQKQKQLSNGSSRKRKHELINNTKRRYQNANDSPSEPSVPDGIAPIESTSVVEIPLSPVYDTESVELNAYEKSLLSGEVFVSSEEGPVFGYFPGMDDKPIHEIYPCQRPSASAEEPCSCAFHLNNVKVLKKKLYNVVETSKLAAQLRRRLNTTAACAKW